MGEVEVVFVRCTNLDWVTWHWLV